MVRGLVRGRLVRRHREADQGQGGDEHPHRRVDREKAQLGGVGVRLGAQHGMADEQVQQDRGGQKPVQNDKGGVSAFRHGWRLCCGWVGRERWLVMASDARIAAFRSISTFAASQKL